MTRKIVMEALREASSKLDYAFHSGFEYRMGESIIAYPALWLSPLKVAGVEGRNEGRMTYRIVLHLMRLASQKVKPKEAMSSEERAEAAWEKLEQDALELYRALANHPKIASVQVAECAAGEFSLTNHGEISMTVKMDVVLPFCRLDNENQ